MTTIYTNEKEVKKIAKIAFPDYNGRKFKVEVTTNPIDVRSYCEGGSRDHYVFVRLDTFETFEMGQQSAYDPIISGADSVQLIPGLICVEHSYFCGKDSGITIYVHPVNSPNLIENKNVELTDVEQKFLLITRSYVSNARKEYAKYHGIYHIWEETKESLIKKGFLTKSGAINLAGKNVISGKRLREKND